MSVDPAQADPKNPQSWNRYAYVLGNPLKYVDPFGEVFSFASAEAEAAFWDYWESLEVDSQNMANLMELEDSEIGFQVNLTEVAGEAEGNTGYDGERVLINIEPTRTHEDASINSRFAHEFQHGIQVNEGRMGFRKRNGVWAPQYYDLQDEVEAHQAQARSATGSDMRDPKMSKFVRAMGSRAKAGVLEPYYIKQGLKGKFTQIPFPKIPGVVPGSVFRGPTLFGRVR